MRLFLLLPLLFARPVHAQTFDRIVLVVLENTDYQAALRQPYLSELARRGASFTNFDAETHPSQPNYLAMISGSTHGVTDDKNWNLDARHLGDLLEEKNLGWRVYAEGYPGHCFLGEKKNKYVRKHVPFLSFRNVQRDSARCSRIVNADAFESDARGGSLPAFSLYVPDLDNDGHDTGAPFADKFLRRKFGALLDDPTFLRGTLFAVTFDENDNDEQHPGARNQIFTVLVGPMVRAGAVNTSFVNHYSLLKLVEDNFGLGRLTRGDESATAITGIWAE